MSLKSIPQVKEVEEPSMDSGGEEPEKSSNSLEPPLKDANDLEMNEVYCQNDDIDYRDGIGANPLTTSEVMDITLRDIDNVVNLEEGFEDLPACTLRMWILAMCLATVIAGVDTFFAFRFPAIAIGAIVAQLVAYPLGVLWARVVPKWRIPLGKVGSIELNPGKFNSKEHALIYLFTNTVISTGLLRNTQVEQVRYFDENVGIGRFILYDIVGFLIAWGLAGLSIPILVDREELIWPEVLSSCALMEALHAGTKSSFSDWKMSRFGFFVWAFVGSFVWYWVSDLILPFIADLGAFPSWCKPKNAVLGQVFGVKNGMGLLPISFDWSTISTLSNPLLTPVWAAGTIFASFVFWVWIVLPGLYYQDWWETAHLPLMSNSIFNKKGTTYTVQKVVTSDWKLDLEKYKAYSPVYLPIGFLLYLALGLGGFSSMMIMFFWKFKTEVWTPFKQHQSKPTAKYLPASTRVFQLIYLFSMAVGIGLGFAFVEGWHRDTQITSGGYIVSVVIGVVLFLPVALIESKSTFTLNMEGFFNIVSAFWFEGQPITSLYFLNFGYAIFQHAMHFTQGAKLGYYMKTPPRITVIVLFAAGIWSSLVTSSVTGFVLYHFPDVCTTDAKNNMTCKSQKTAFNTQIIWGLFGSHLFGGGGRYNFIMYFFLVGAGVSIVVIAMQLLRPKSQFWHRISPALLMSGAENIPTATGLHYGSWMVAVLLFNFIVHKRNSAWWRKYNLILASALDCGVAIAAIIVYFAVSYTGGSANYKWWGTTVVDAGCDDAGCPFKSKSTISLPKGLW
ncbi:hypothetical protein BZL39_E00140 [Zygosaccharomyces parabailii]|uniref:BN860_16578g1_1 n=1 Tax=Zygosaccharomyces bailii (strain CLIB 213 / ATCC 58445 / CBS 680 / BCRC 21525 / NBRC 1098 / NCYC 1416 / NRRL Y-2227) TaxID=1333698 RepID=A0A8J2T4D6_ZYGB2|nr:hypothetical protein BZL39_E00140 [Zygosaccharomyces parabailii]CDF88707.1 BN860_16578g1_1 [Zygosaccharomyces bailii CLIB 213]